MKVIDKTPFLGPNGELTLFGKIRGWLSYGLEWSQELEAQKAVLERLEKILESGFVAIRNYPLAGGSVLVPLILIGPPGLYVLQVTAARGLYEAKGDEWNVITGEVSHPARLNLVRLAMRFARAVEVLLNRQGITLPAAVEPVIIATNPGLHVQTFRPAVRIILSDGIERFALALAQSRPVLSAADVTELSERILNPRRPSEKAAEAAAAAEAPPPAAAPPVSPEAPAAVAPFREGFAFEFQEEEEQLPPAPPPSPAATAARAVPATKATTRPAPPSRARLNRRQILLLVVMGMLELCLVLGLIALFFFYRP